MNRARLLLTSVVCGITIVFGCGSSASTAAGAETGGFSVLTPRQRNRVEAAVDNGLKFLASQQQRDGSFRAPAAGQPGVTSLCVLAFLSRGHLPGQGPYGQTIERAIAFCRSAQRSDGLFSQNRPESTHRYLLASHAATYNHAITGLMLTEVYGMLPNDQPQQAVAFQGQFPAAAGPADLRVTIERAIQFSMLCHPQPKRFPNERGAWRYLRRYGLNDADLSITSWQVMFLRSARNAGFDIPARDIEQAVKYIKSCYDEKNTTFVYEIVEEEPELNRPRAMAGAGILALSLAGQHHTEMAQKTGDWLLQRPFTQYDRPIRGENWHVYSAFYSSQAMFQLGGEYWENYFPTFVDTVTAHQSRDGAWRPAGGLDRRYGEAYTTAMTVLALTPPYQLLPIFQR